MSVTYHGTTFDRLGHASVRIAADSEPTVYIDPWSEVIDESPGDGDVVIVTHDDFDHYDPDAIAAVAKVDATVAAYEAIDTADLDHEVIRLPLDGQTEVRGLTIRTIPAYNDPNGLHVDDDGEPFHAKGEVVGVQFEYNGDSIYYPSDTDFLDHHEAINADVFLPPIGGHYTMHREEAARFAQGVEPNLVLPLHYDTFEAIETDARAFKDELETVGIRVELME